MRIEWIRTREKVCAHILERRDSMQKGQTSRRGGIQDLLCPFEYVKIIRGAGAANGVATLQADGVNFRIDCGVLYEVSDQ